MQSEQGRLAGQQAELQRRLGEAELKTELNCKAAEQAIHEIMQKVVDLGGAITGEHGIGIAKSPFLTLQHTPAEINAMRAVKHALDPNNILAPGQIFDPLNVWEYRPVKVTLPWDKH